MLLGLILFISLALIVAWWLAVRHCRHGRFYLETPLGWPLGIFVWGDGLVLLPWWLLVTIASYWLTPVWMVRIVLLFWTLRALYEVVYWLNNQATGSSEIPPTLRSVKWLGPKEAAILYQVGQMCIALTALIGFLLTTQL